MPYGKALVDTVESSGNLAITGNTAITGNVTTTGTLTSSTGTTYPIVSGTAQTASGSSVDFTGIPSWVKRITLTGVGISFAAAGAGEVRIGSGSLTASGYTTRVATITNAVVPSIQTSTTSMAAFVTSTAAATVSGMCVLVLNDATTNTWVATTTTNRSDGLIQQYIGSVSLSGVLDRISLVATTSTFDAGSVNILYE